MPSKVNFIKFFDEENFSQFQGFVKQKVRPGQKIVNRANLMFLEDVNHHIV